MDIDMPEPDNYDHLFMPELIANLDAAVAEAGLGNNMTLKQLSEHFEEKWRRARNASPDQSEFRLTPEK